MNAETIFKYFPALTPKQKEQFKDMASLYSAWNAKVNLISRKDIDNLYIKHVLHSLAIAKGIDFSKGIKSVIDVGTGGGFPGVSLAVLFPSVQFHLVDSIAKKVKAVEDIAKQLSLKNVTTEAVRAERITEKRDLVLGRGVANLFKFYQLTKHLTNRQGNLAYLKGPEGSAELAAAGIKFKKMNISSFFEGEFFLSKALYYSIYFNS